MELVEVAVMGHETRVQIGGQGPDLLFLHGEANTSAWGEIHDELAHQFTVYAPVHPGFGGDELPAWLYDSTDLAFHNAALTTALALDRPLVAGVSLGGWLTLDLACHRPDLVGAVLAVGSLGLRPEQPMPDLFIKQAPEALGYLAESLDAAAVDPMTGDIDAATDLWVELAAQARLMWERPYDRKLGRRLQLIDCPAAVVWGAADRLLPVEHGRRLAELIGCEIEVVPEAGHMVTIDAPAAVAAAAVRLQHSRQD